MMFYYSQKDYTVLKGVFVAQVSVLTREQQDAKNTFTARPVNTQLSLVPSARSLSQSPCSLE